MKIQFFVLILVAALTLQTAFAQQISVQTSKTTYNYGDYLSLTISVSQITGKNAILRIVDSDGVKSSPIPVEIKKQNTTITTPVPFNSEIFREGKYQIEIEYDGAKASAPFQLVDAGNVVMPFGSNIIVPQWTDGAITDSMFFKFLVEKKIIILPEGQKLGQNLAIPDWYKTNGKWWSQQKISDSEFIKGLQYLVDKHVVKI
ncbi:MAG: hypothetical protein QXN55_05930 [Candidatus Nitrosotenuis sp.]